MAQEHNIICGLELNHVADLNVALDNAREQDFDFIAVPLAHPRYERVLTGLKTRQEPFTRSDLLLSSSQWGSFICGKISPLLDLDSPDENIRSNSVLVLRQELNWAVHLAVAAVLLPTPSFRCFNYAQILYQTLQSPMYVSQFWIRIPIKSREETLDKKNKQVLSDNHRGLYDSWEAWNNLRTLCEHHPNIFAALEITEDLPSQEVINKWLGEPVKALIIPTKLFLTNSSGFPALPKKHQEVVSAFFKHKVQVIVKGSSKHNGGIKQYQDYLRFLITKYPPYTEENSIEVPYLDYLQAPLQPLMDNLESSTYEVFEKDATKYIQYQQAIYKCLLTKPADSTTTLMVVGAGRGPLVKAALRASQQANRKLRVYAVEKNPNAVITLKNMKVDLNWGDQVTIVDSDMRTWNAPELADILVSELLGSFGDNELSPECLDGAQRFLKPNGVSIPTDYTSYVAPLSSSKLYNEVKSYKDLKHFETAYVVKLHNVNVVSTPQPCFTFTHPNYENPINNTRYISLKFPVSCNTTIHGLAGYFDSKLFDDVHLSTNPATHTPNMFSWFPIYFPLREPMYIPKDSIVEVHFWRCVSKSKVWYEWAITSPDVSPIHNTAGRSYWIGL